eukprot:CAMPEP_0198313450 /NCGR_PEP_ID=MMETSP1450-20131203/4463_1 /TAXON_ID=753684 ORGANISM="Madagascaria erythrocladiodes, Strain CCMP3234" /NCGR_SAMPLE_ID=MMETSP1450 /ASSEMBLY_ACC=CAM_ASM_001115 /LENGTH=171 /DNA_ID=CAMNT_0044016445 /DNA_START=116 /DNA_END=631 /DNA_ORIENTATION=-
MVEPAFQFHHLRMVPNDPRFVVKESVCQRQLLRTSSAKRELCSSRSRSRQTLSLTKMKGSTEEFYKRLRQNNEQPEDGHEEAKSKRMIGDLVDFPCKFTFKVIGLRQGDFVNDISDSVCAVLDIERHLLDVSFRDKGKYRSITVNAPCNTADQVYDIYRAIDRDPRVKFKF